MAHLGQQIAGSGGRRASLTTAKRRPGSKPAHRPAPKTRRCCASSISMRSRLRCLPDVLIQELAGIFIHLMVGHARHGQRGGRVHPQQLRRRLKVVIVQGPSAGTERAFEIQGLQLVQSGQRRDAHFRRLAHGAGRVAVGDHQQMLVAAVLVPVEQAQMLHPAAIRSRARSPGTARNIRPADSPPA